MVAKCVNRTSGYPALKFLFGLIDIESDIPLVMSANSIGLGLNQSGALAGSGTLYGFTGCLINCQNVVAINGYSWYAVSRCLGGNLSVSRGHVKRSVGGVEIVLADKYDGGILGRSQVERFMKGPMAGGTVSEKRHYSLLAPAYFGAKGYPYGNGNSRGHQAARSVDTDILRKKVHAAPAATAAAAGFGTEFGQNKLWI